MRKLIKPNRSHRYKPFSASYKVPDMLRYRRRNRRMGMDFRRQVRTLPPLGTDWSTWAMRHGAYGQPDDEMRADGFGDDDYGAFLLLRRMLHTLPNTSQIYLFLNIFLA